MNTAIDMTGEQEYHLPCAEALLAGTLALMTGHAQACCDEQRQRMRAKIVATLARLAGHALLSPQFRAALWSLRTHWDLLQAREAAAVTSHWQAGPSTLQ